MGSLGEDADRVRCAKVVLGVDSCQEKRGRKGERAGDVAPRYRSNETGQSHREVGRVPMGPFRSISMFCQPVRLSQCISAYPLPCTEMTPQEKARKGSRRDLRLHISCHPHTESERPPPTLPPLTKFLLSREITKTAKMDHAVTKNQSR